MIDEFCHKILLIEGIVIVMKFWFEFLKVDAYYTYLYNSIADKQVVNVVK